jgi:hypothetical protein
VLSRSKQLPVFRFEPLMIEVVVMGLVVGELPPRVHLALPLGEC